MTPHKLNQYVNVFKQADWKALEHIIEQILSISPEILETPHTGDSRDEPVKLNVVRFLIKRNNLSKTTHEPYCSELLQILKRANFLPTMIQHTGIEGLQIMRLQLNLMSKGSFIGIHTDQENDPNYLATVVVRTNSLFSNGKLILYGKKKRTIAQKNRTVFLMDASIEHEVTPVTEGCRNSFIIVLGKITPQ